MWVGWERIRRHNVQKIPQNNDNMPRVIQYGNAQGKKMMRLAKKKRKTCRKEKIRGTNRIRGVEKYTL